MVHLLLLGNMLRPELGGLWEGGAMNPLPLILALGGVLAFFYLLSRT